MKKKKNIILIISLCTISVLYIVLFYFFSGIKDATKGYIIVSDLGGYYCQTSTCQFKQKSEIDSSNKNFLIYQNNHLKGIYNLNLQERWNFFQNNSWKNLYGDFLGVEDSLNVKIFDITYEEITEDDLKKTNITSKNLDTNEKLVLDIDQNGEKDYFIAVSNQTENTKNETYFSALYLILNNKSIKIYHETSDEIYSLPYYNVFSVFKLDEKKNAKIIVNKGYYDSIGESSLVMLELNGKKVKEIVADSAK